MKKYTYSFALIMLAICSFGQSVTISPQRTESEGNTEGDNLSINSNSNIIGLVSLRYNGTNILKTAVNNNDNLLLLSSGGYFNSSTPSYDKAIIRMKATENWSPSANGTKISFATTQNGNNSSIERMLIDNDGEVGVGVLDPQANLHINQTNAGLVGKIKLSNVGSGVSSNDGLDISLFSSSDFLYPLGAGILNKENNSLLLGTNNAYTMYLNPSGKVGISNGFPSGKLHINHLASSASPTIHLQSTGSSSSIIKASSTSPGEWENHFLTNASASSNIVYWTNSISSATPLILTGDGDAIVERNAVIGGFTNLGTGSPKIKIKELSGTFSTSTGSFTTITHGLTLSKILQVSVLVNGNSGNDVGENYIAVSGFEFSKYISPSAVMIYGKNGNDTSLLGRNIKVLVTYKE